MTNEEIKTYTDVGFKVGVVAILLIYFRKIIDLLRGTFAGPDKIFDKIDFAALWFLGLLTWMIYKEGERSHEWHLYGEWWIGLVGILTLLMYGFKDVVKSIVSIKSGKHHHRSTEQTTHTSETENI